MIRISNGKQRRNDFLLKHIFNLWKGNWPSMGNMAADRKGASFVASFISRAAPGPLPQELRADLSYGSEGDVTALCRALVNAAGPTAVNSLYGEEIRPQVDEWLAFASVAQNDRDPVSSSTRLRTLDSYLLTRTVFIGIGTTIGLADIAVFVSIHDPLAALPPEEQKNYPNLLRWIDYVQNKDDVSHVYEWIPVQKAKFDPPASSAEPLAKKVPAAAQGPSIKDKVAPASVTTTSSQQKQATVEAKQSPDFLPATKGHIDDAKIQQKDKKEKPEVLVSGKVVIENDAKDQQKAKKESVPLQKDAFGLEILDIRVGVIKTVKKHPTADTLYVEEIDIGEGSCRQVVSGLAKYLTEDQMLNRRVVVLANVKPSKLRDVLSAGLVLCTSNEDHSQCEPVIPPKEAIVGERVMVEGYEGLPEAVLNPKKKQWDKLYPDLHTDDTGVACYKGKPLTTSAGPCTSSITKGTIK